MELKNTTRGALLDYFAAQLDHLFPDRVRDARSVLDRNLDEALDRVNKCINSVRMWRPDEFNYLHSAQNTIFTYYLSNSIWRNQANENICTKLFYLNKALNSFDCFYDTALPDIFFIGHTLGIVLARVTYSDYFVLYQNSTVGKNHGASPVLEKGVILYPNSAIIGNCHIRPRTFVAQGQSLIDTDTPGNCVVFANAGQLVCKPAKHDILADFFRDVPPEL